MQSDSSRLRRVVGVIRLFYGLHCEIVIFENGKVMVSEPIPLSKATRFQSEIAIRQEKIYI